MKLIINKNQLSEPPERFLRGAGYSYVRGSYNNQDSFVHRLGRSYYPRFHMYIKEQKGLVVFSLHLDQKRPSYPGTHAHNAEYEGEVVEAEIERLKKLIGDM